MAWHEEMASIEAQEQMVSRMSAWASCGGETKSWRRGLRVAVRRIEAQEEMVSRMAAEASCASVRIKIFISTPCPAPRSLESTSDRWKE